MNQSKLIQSLQSENEKLMLRLQQFSERENASLNRQQQIEALFDNAPVELYLKDRDGRYIRINKQFEKIFNVKNEDLIGKFPAFAHDSELAKTTRQQDLEVLCEGNIVRREVKARLPIDNRLHTLLTIKFPIFEAGGNIDGLGAIVTDITDQKQAEARFLDIVNTVDGIVWEADAETFDFSFVSQSAERLLGYPISDWMIPGFWLEHLYVEDRAAARQYCLDCLESGQTSYKLEYRFMSRDQGIVWCRDIVSVNVEEGKPRWLRGIMIDITESKKTELAIKSAENRFRTIFMSAPLGLALTDIDSGDILEINPAYSTIVGRSADDVKSTGWAGFTYADDLDEDMRQLKRLQDGEISDYKLLKRFVKADHSIVWTELFVTRISGQNEPDLRQYIAIIEDITERQHYQERIWHQANYDFLTGLPNRNMLQDRLTELIKKEKRAGMEFALLLIDLDQFKDINDTLGHDKGDELLIGAAKRITSCVRESDTVARLGGDEFVIILSELSILSGVEQVAQNVLDALAEPFILGEESAYISASMGITIFPDDGNELLQLFKNIDQAMYSAKNSGRNCYQFFTRHMQLFAHLRMQLINDLHVAIRERQFELFYQPIVNLNDGQVLKAEALIRWRHAEKGLVCPADFIPVAEETRLMTDIGDWVFVEAARQVKKWKSKLHEDFQISVNVSPVQFQNNLDKSWNRYMEKLGIEGRSINIEITETLVMTSDIAAQDILLAFRDAGIQVSLDDFGTGYSSLAYLRKFDIDYLKIDQSFVQNLTQGSDDIALCAAIIVMAHTLGIRVIAEGIETDEQRQLLISMDCDYGQGDYFSRPLPAQEFELKYRNYPRHED